MRSPSGKVSAKPNPAIEGQDVTVTSSGGDKVYMSVDGGEWQEVSLDGQGQGVITVPSGSRFVTISDRRLPNPSTVCVEVWSSNQ